MILADKIILLRKKHGWSQEELAERLDVSRQSVSKWESGLSIPDLNRIIGMSSLFGVSTDYLLKDEIEELIFSEPKEECEESIRVLEAEEANAYLDTVNRISWRMAFAVLLCILSPVCLIVLGGLASEAFLPMRESVAICIGLVTLFALVGIAVAIFIPNGIILSKYAFLEEPFIAAYGVKGIVEKRKQSYSFRYIALLTVGTLLCILSVIPLLVFGSLGANDSILICCTGLILVLCSIGVCLMVRACYINGSFERVLQTGDFSAKKKRLAKEHELADAAYWGIATAIYLAVSLLTSAWHISWIVWVIAAALNPLFLYLIDKEKNS
jgi:transcriptional regulator with XRE-family HTH domain